MARKKLPSVVRKLQVEPGLDGKVICRLLVGLQYQCICGNQNNINHQILKCYFFASFDQQTPDDTSQYITHHVKQLKAVNRLLNAALSTGSCDAGRPARSCFHSNSFLHAAQIDWTTKFKMTEKEIIHH